MLSTPVMERRKAVWAQLWQELQVKVEPQSLSVNCDGCLQWTVAVGICVPHLKKNA